MTNFRILIRDNHPDVGYSQRIELQHKYIPSTINRIYFWGNGDVGCFCNLSS